MAAVAAMVLAFLVATVLTRTFLQPGSKFHILDHPNERSLHQRAVPRSGGWAILAALLCGASWQAALQPLPVASLWILSGVGLLALVGMLDDLYDVRPSYRFLLQVLAAGFLIVAGLTPNRIELPGIELWIAPPWIWFLTGAYVVWMTNLYNFMDGMDGLAGGMGVIGFASFALLGWWGGDTLFAALSGVVAASTAGFLLWNIPPARIFMGDAGSSVLGYLAATLSLWGVQRGVFPLMVGVLVFSPFIVDATFTLVRRMLRGERLWKPHREHLYQRLVRLGWSHKRTVLRAYALMFGCALSAFVYVGADRLWQWVLLIGWGGLYVGIIIAVRRMEGSTD